jgi:hypothetical protein
MVLEMKVLHGDDLAPHHLIPVLISYMFWKKNLRARPYFAHARRPDFHLLRYFSYAVLSNPIIARFW